MRYFERKLQLYRILILLCLGLQCTCIKSAKKKEAVKRVVAVRLLLLDLYRVLSNVYFGVSVLSFPVNDTYVCVCACVYVCVRACVCARVHIYYRVIHARVALPRRSPNGSTKEHNCRP